MGVHGRIARTDRDLAAAKHLVRRRYAWRGYQISDDVSALDAAARREANGLVLVAADRGSVVGTLSVGFDGAGGLLAEGSYGDVIKAKRAAGRQICEVTRLAIAEEADSKVALAALFSVLLTTAIDQGATDMVIEVNPRHVVFYRRVLGFVIAGDERFCERAQAPSILLAVDMEEFERRVMSFNAKALSQGQEARAA